MSEYAVVRAYTTPDSAVSYLTTHARIAHQTTLSFALQRTTAAKNCNNNTRAN